MSNPVFGAAVDPGKLRDAAEATLKIWLPTYIANWNREQGHQELAVPKKYRYRPDDQPFTWRGNEAAVTVTVGQTDEVCRFGNGSYRIVWQLVIDIYIGGNTDWRKTEDIVAAYAWVVTQLLVQKPDLGGVVETLLFKTFAPFEREVSAAHYEGQAKLTFAAAVTCSIDSYGGPTVPNPAPPPNPPTAQTVESTVALGGTT